MVMVHRSWQELPDAARGCTMALGAFDGLHLGHQALLDAARAGAPGRPLLLAAFEPLPRQFFQPHVHPARLTLAALRAEAAAGLGVTQLVELSFDAAMAAMSGEDFATNVIARALAPAHLVVGHDFRFGAGRQGDAALLEAVGQRSRFGVTVVPPVLDPGGTRISSTRIREALAGGDIALANALLGRPWRIAAEVVHGEKRGRTIGWPTANMVLDDQCAPRFGIYVVSTRLPDGTWVQGVANFGRTPTTGLRDPLLEVNLFDFAGDLYGQHLVVDFHAFLRPEATFAGLEALVAQIGEDAEAARAWFASQA